MYRSIMQPQHPNWDAPRRSPAPSPADMAALLQAADALGAQVQYRHQGFLVNRRQQRMAGLAALEFAQMLARVAAARKEGNEVTAPDSGASVCGRGPSGIGGGGRGGSGSHAVGWRDAMELIVKWRQVAEPNDQVLWVDLLTEREFSAGFGSHTPMFTGQTKCVRYYMNFDRALAVVKRLLLEGRVAYDADNNGIDLSAPEAREALQKATTARDLWAAVGKDWWVVVPIKSSVRGGHEMEGTRLTVVNLSKPGRKMRVGTGKLGAGGSLGKDGNGAGGTATADAAEDLGRLGLDAESALEADEDSTSAAALSNGGASSATGDQQHPQQQQGVQPDSYEFSIRTPVTPSRWEDYDVELSALFDRLVQALADGDRPAAADAAVRFAYCWYNFMPLARGSALCGYVSLLGAFLAAEVPIRSLIPSGVQTDWEAILESSPDAFIAALKPWMWPPELEAGGGAGEAAVEAPCAAVGALPAVGKVLGTMRARLEALNGSDGPKI